MSISFDPNILASVYKALYNYDNKQKKRSRLPRFENFVEMRFE